MTYRQLTQVFASLTLCALMAACASRPSSTTSGSTLTGGEGHYKVGQPYQVKNQWYYPHEDYTYDETGVASWYGDDFHEKQTANGEVYNKNELTAAHKTLPLPTLARVTNMENGKSIVVRVNDRGPFSGSRIIDMSQRSAQLLGFENQGTAKVRVQVLADESKAIADAMRIYGGPSDKTTIIQAEKAAVKPTETPVSVYPVPGDREPPMHASYAPPTLRREESTETLRPVYSTAKTREELIKTKPVPYALQLPVSDSTRLFVQAGAFTVEGNAYKLQKKLARLGESSISTAVINGTRFYRVRVGPVDTVPQADDLLAKVKRSGISGARTVVD